MNKNFTIQRYILHIILIFKSSFSSVVHKIKPCSVTRRIIFDDNRSLNHVSTHSLTGTLRITRHLLLQEECFINVSALQKSKHNYCIEPLIKVFKEDSVFSII